LKFILTLSLLVSSLSAFSANYSCTVENGKNIGSISLTGNPLTSIYTQVKINNIVQLRGKNYTDHGYIFLLDKKTKEPTYAFDAVGVTKESFYLTVFGKRRGIIGMTSAFWISEYNCKIQN
jgi:hypothetical protein